MAYNFPEQEQKILKFWQDNSIFKKLQEKNKGKFRWSFLDGPITANNPMAVHHAWGRTYKDLLQRYHAMQGHDERYQNGFDCQGLWVEVEVEKELGFKTKKDIEAYGIDKFVEKCKERVKKYSAIQTQQSVRLGQWMDWEHSYFTMSDENNYAIWHFLKKCHEKEYLYKGRDSVPWCPRCGTAISQHEILTEEYKEIVHDSVYFQLPIITRKNEYLLVWTTTPWTLPANIAIAVDEKIDYALVKNDRGNFWLAKDLVQKVFKGEHKILQTVKGKKLVGLRYLFAFDDLPKVKEVAQKNPENFHTVVATDNRIMPITTEDGTGLVHTAVSAGQEDFQLGKKLGLPLIEVIGEDASYLDGLGEFSGQNAKKNPNIILDYLSAQKNYVFEILPYKHKYPTCWRCKTELVWRVVDEWYISMEKLRKPLEKIVKKINWIPSFGKERELDWLKNMHDWLISKKRYWGLALPIFECQECGNFEVIGSKEELKKRAIEGWEAFEGNSPHRPWIDAVKIQCKKCKTLAGRIKDVGNPWLDAGIVPYSTMKYFSDMSYWKKWFPAQVVAESFPGQFKNWFYSLLVMSTVLENTEPAKTIFGYASVKDEKGEEMHKSKGNAIWFDEAVEKIGADPMRWMYARQNPAENMLFGYKTADEIKRKLLTLYNVYTFFTTYVKKEEFPVLAEHAIPKSKNILDKWIISRIGHVAVVAESNLEKYDIAKATLAIEDFFINDVSLWYLRRSRKRFHENSLGRKEAIETLYYVLLQTAKLIAPVMPFFAEAMYHALRAKGMPESVHLCDWPSQKGKINTDLHQKMDEVRSIVTLALAQRNEHTIKVRQPLLALKIKNKKSKIKNNGELLELIKDEVNLKEVIFDDTITKEVELDLNITEELKEEGIIRDLIRWVQDLRKEQGLKPEDKISAWFFGTDALNRIVEKNKELLAKEIRAVDITIGQAPESIGLAKEIQIENEAYAIKIQKVS
ncbi:MAG: isoleucine--tRNA ligase [Candidatus Staskawiczbacteria bacterium RIFCSPLOWO2_01_FULL_40_39]|uniref:Isoleucine--tRNA ligase n=1 Tax=Candidatus Staskawiczbacteria bacterium RIFCSPHIGHO2_01_FULL_39_25 TaxID=1802202 RepID=A0A1G2HQ80_9BACT|nr:MAG: isoleucine--tRNA ligase [Candidatus Staskawiczbacteria bacterium RIFCSPHIGHO2_01_FULL_39_25]OGZ73806.1 MAG: isoleucine--tRNA ligase [Candidatus Staskawiczbacteria bacterium RIFCSPLOWO2_01_FULL_40_39]OGZ76641.1 MAG: isoleucine--tRNA ligase [Candidatus Staskawiczbacteria bacterium RIFCSPLOWO2_02_FULL_39_8]